MVSYKVAVLFLILTVINSCILINYYGEENLSNMTTCIDCIGRS